ncbi:MAG: serine hydrolase domain-containing protein, partial [Rubrobacteraceae bacterium]
LIRGQLREENVAGATMSVVKDGRLVFAKGYGYADLEEREPVVADRTLFYPGSAGKLFTWTAVMQLVEEGKLDLDADINTYLDFEVPDTYDQPITMSHLMTHTAGLEEQLIALLAEDRQDVLPLRDFLTRYMPQRVYPPGEYFAYSNYGTALAGYIVQRVSGESYEQYIEENILKPLDMERSAATQTLPENLADDLSNGYHYQNGTYDAKDFEWISAAPAAPVHVTAPDMAKFMLAHLQNGEYNGARILEENTALSMHRQHFTHDPRLPGMAYGFVTSQENDQRVIWHMGESARFTTVVALLPEQNAGLFVSYNTPFDASQTLSAFLDHYYPLQEEISATQSPPGMADQTGRLAGTYITTRVAHNSPQKIIGWLATEQVSVVNDNTLQVGERRYARAEPELFKQVDGERLLTFREDSQGQVTHLFWGPFAFFKVAPYETLGFQLPLLAVCVALFVSALVVFPVAALVDRWRSVPAKSSGTVRASRAARWLAGVTGVLNLGLLAWFVVTLLGYAQTYVWPTGTVSAITRLWLLSVPLTVGVVVFAALAWKNRFWGVIGRVHYALVALASIMFLLFLYSWNLIGL